MLIPASRLDTSRIPCVVEGIFPEVGNGFAHGASGTGKSYACVFKLGLDISNGADWFGHATMKGHVVLCLGEGQQDAGIRIKAQLAFHAEEIAARAAVIAEREGPEAAGAFMAAQPPYDDRNLFIETAPFGMPFGTDKRPSTGMLQFLANLRAREIKPVFIIFDAMDDFADERSTANHTAANRYVTGLKYLVEQLDCFVLGIGHDTEDGKKMLGNLRFRNAADVMVAIKPEGGGDSEVSSVTPEKGKSGGLKFDAFAYRAIKKVWDEPVWDEETDEPVIDEETGQQKTDLVETYVVTLHVDTAGEDGSFSTAATADGGDWSASTVTELPVMRDPAPQKRKRNGIKPERRPRPPVQVTAPEPEPDTADPLGAACEDCDAPAGQDCEPLPSSTGVTFAPGTMLHPSRAQLAATTAA